MLVCVCLFSIQIETPGRIRTKFGTEVVLGLVLTRYPPPGMGCVEGVWGPSGASDVHFGCHSFGPQIQIRKDLGPMSFWNHGHSL